MDDRDTTDDVNVNINANEIGSGNEMKVEPVLVIPAKLTKSAYAVLVSHNCVGRKWHNEGRYGSRTHPVESPMGDCTSASKRIGLPLLENPETIDWITSVLSNCDVSHRIAETSVDGNGGKQSLLQLLSKPGVELIYETPVLSNRIPKAEPFDATTHPNRMPRDFTSNMKRFLEDNERLFHIQSPSRSSSFTFCEIFSGIGGFGRALEALGGKCVFASEIYKPSRRLYRTNLNTGHLPDGEIGGDIWDVDSQTVPHHDLLVGGFPCQPFSRLGDQMGLADGKNTIGRAHDAETGSGGSGRSGGRGQLFTQIVRLLKDCQPTAFLLENVPGLITTDHGNALRTILSALESVGYDVTHEVCSSRGLTVQSRKRLYIVGIKKTLVHKTQQSSTPDTKPSTTSTPNVFRFPFIPDLKLRAEHALHTDEELLQTSFSETGVPTELTLRDEDPPQSPTPAALFRLTEPQMTQLLHRSKSWKPAKLAWHDTTIDTLDSHYGITIGKGNSQLVPSPAPHNPRRFTPRECARIMGFDDSFCLGEYIKPPKKFKSSTDNSHVLFNSFIKEQYFMLGNAVCPPVIAAIAGGILEYCSLTTIPYEMYTHNARGGMWVAIQMALDAVAPCQRANVYKRLRKEYSA